MGDDNTAQIVLLQLLSQQVLPIEIEYQYSTNMIHNTHKKSKYVSEEEYEVEKILDQRKEHNRIVYLVKWKDYPHSQNTWEPKENLKKATIKLKEWEKRKSRMNLTYDDEETEGNKDSYSTKRTMSRKSSVKKQKAISKRQKLQYHPTSVEMNQYEKKLRNQKKVWEKSQYMSLRNEEQQIVLQQIYQQKIRNIESVDSTKMQKQQHYFQQIIDFGKEANQQIFNSESNFIAQTSSLHPQLMKQWLIDQGREEDIQDKNEEQQIASITKELEKIEQNKYELEYNGEKNIRHSSYNCSNSCISQPVQTYCTLQINSPAVQFQTWQVQPNQQEIVQLSELLQQQRFGIEQLSDQIINLIDEPLKINEPDLFDYLKNESDNLIDYDTIARIVKRDKDNVNNNFYFLAELKNGKMMKLQNYQQLKQARPLLLLDYYQKMVALTLNQGMIPPN